MQLEPFRHGGRALLHVRQKMGHPSRVSLGLQIYVM